MRHTRTERHNHDHYAKVIVARHQRNDIEDAKVIEYMDKVVAQAQAQIYRMTETATGNVNRNFVKRFLEVIK